MVAELISGLLSRVDLRDMILRSFSLPHDNAVLTRVTKLIAWKLIMLRHSYYAA